MRVVDDGAALFRSKYGDRIWEFVVATVLKIPLIFVLRIVDPNKYDLKL